MDQLRSSINLRVYAQKDPLIEYKQEAYKIFSLLMDQIYQDIASNLFRMTLQRMTSLEELLANMPQEMVHQTLEQLGQFDGVVEETPEEEPAVEVPVTFHREMPKVGRNDLCPCGSGKKFKKCCGQNN